MSERIPAPVPDFLPSGFRNRAEELPYSKPPGWMTWTWVFALLVTGGIAVLTLNGPMDESVMAVGEVRPADYDLVFPRSPGIIAEVCAHPGQSVTAGAILARLDTTDLDRESDSLVADRAQAVADLSNAQALLAQLQAAPLPLDQWILARQVESQQEVLDLRKDLLRRLESLQGPNSIPLVDLIRERLAVKQAEAEVIKCEKARDLLDGPYGVARLAESQARVMAAKAAIDRLDTKAKQLDSERERRIVRAPADGQIVGRSVRSPGEKVDLGAAMFKVAHGPTRILRLWAGEDRVSRIHPGMLVRFRTRSDPNRLTPSSTGRIAEVALDRGLQSETTADRSNSYAIDVMIENTNSDLPLGSAVDAEIVLDKRPFWRLLMMKSEAQAGK